MENMLKNYGAVCVFGASSPATKKIYISAAYRLGELLATHNIECVCGAGRAGLMQAVTEGALSLSGRVTGIIPQFMVDNGWSHPQLSHTIVTPDMHTRKQMMIESCDAIIALPGGCGTFEELLEVITWKQLGLHSKPIIILNTAGYYDSLIALLNHAIEEHFMKDCHKEIWDVVDTPENAMLILSQHKQEFIPIESKY